MKKLLITLILTSASAFGQFWQQSDSLTPSDLGISKYSIQSNPPIGSVSVLRSTIIRDGKEPEIREVISYTGGKPDLRSILLYNPIFFPYPSEEIKNSPITIKWTAGTETVPNTNLVGSGFSDAELSFTFKDKADHKTLLVFKVTIESVESAVQRLPELKTVSEGNHDGWTYIASILTKK